MGNDGKALRPLIDVGRDTLPGEVDWWFLSPEHVDGFSADIVETLSLAHRASLMFIACQWHAQKQRVLPRPLIEALAFVLALGKEVAEQSLANTTLNPAEIDSAAEHITAACREMAMRRLDVGERRRRGLEAQPVELREALFRLVRHSAEKGEPTPVAVLVALQHILGLVRPKTGLPLASSEVLGRTGLPNVDDLATFLAAAKEDGSALQPPHEPDLDLDGFQDIAAGINSKIDAHQWALSPEALAKRVGSKRSTIRDWRKLPQYRRLAKAAASMPSLATAAWNKWRQADQA